MMQTNQPPRQHMLHKQPKLAHLWSLCFIAILAWGVQLFSNYALVEWHCSRPESIAGDTVKIVMVLISLMCFLTAVFALIGSLKLKRKYQGLQVPNAQRVHFMLHCGILISAFLAVTILVQGWPVFILPLCSAGGGG